MTEMVWKKALGFLLLGVFAFSSYGMGQVYQELNRREAYQLQSAKRQHQTHQQLKLEIEEGQYKRASYSRRVVVKFP